MKIVKSVMVLVNDLQRLLGNLWIAKWTSNIREVVNSIPVSERAKEANDLDLDFDILTTERALGLEQCIISYYSSLNLIWQSLARRGIISMVRKQ